MLINDEIGLNGRFGNQVFQYSFLLAHRQSFGGTFANRPWDGEALFEVQPGTHDLPQFPVVQEDYASFEDCPIRQRLSTLEDVCVRGYFQNYSSLYAKHLDVLQNHFRYKAAALAQDQRVAQLKAELQMPLVALHLRRGDYGFNIHFRTPEVWALRALEALRAQIGPFRLYVATEDPTGLADALEAYDPVFADDWGGDETGFGFFLDWQVMRRADAVLISNSSFSFSAALLALQPQIQWRPSLPAGGFIPFDAKTDPAMLRDGTAEEYGPAFMSPRAQSRTKYKIGRLLGRFPRKSKL